MRIVQFNNGKWALERGMFFKEYCDLSTNLWWNLWEKNYVYKYCLADTKEELLLKFDHLKPFKVIRREKFRK